MGSSCSSTKAANVENNSVPETPRDQQNNNINNTEVATTTNQVEVKNNELNKESANTAEASNTNLPAISATEANEQLQDVIEELGLQHQEEATNRPSKEPEDEELNQLIEEEMKKLENDNLLKEQEKQEKEQSNELDNIEKDFGTLPNGEDLDQDQHEIQGELKTDELSGEETV
ncbi:hypothetical protein C9374_014088 [Naegleria lovaniensis]|uniref:Uncharacterized protein n=1 Tax=Naegleria lovaniensis TaxID=51637 RepID=A0AA88KPK4_NAELO|nr:uncharacterized protein C9374_014088 [Naegleria lovaniensis]KAG2389528.1 hypothetical protein C9374_014088 [Naegleria lovaniensis]